MGLGDTRQQAITWASVDPDLCHHMVLLGYNELIVDEDPWNWKTQGMFCIISGIKCQLYGTDHINKKEYGM